MAGFLKEDETFTHVIAIDFGTGASGYGITQKTQLNQKPRIEVFNPCDDKDDQKTVTSILFDNNQNFIDFGTRAKLKYAEIIDDGKTALLFESYKMALFHMQSEVNSIDGRTMPLMKVISESLRFIAESALKKLSEMIGKTMKKDRIRWILTVPALWNEEHKLFMQKAAVKAGIVEDVNSQKLLLCLEPEGASIQCREDADESLKNQITMDSIVTVLDCGGGTVDITVHKIKCHPHESFLCEEVISSSGGCEWGSKYVDEYFEGFLKEFFGEELFGIYKKNATGRLEILKHFELLKKKFNPGEDERSRLQLSYLSENLSQEKLKELIENYNKNHDKETQLKQRGSSCIDIPPKLMISFFEPLFSKIKNKVTELLSQTQLKAGYLPKFIFMVGGFSESPFLKSEIKNTFGNNKISVLIPKRPGVSVIRGACMFGLSPRSIKSRIAKKTYGINTLSPFDPSKHPESKKVTIEGEEFCEDLFDVFVRKDESVGIDESIRKIYCPVRATQTVMKIIIYCTDKKDVEFVSEDGVCMLGELSVEIGKKHQSVEEKTVTVTLLFGATQIIATAQSKSGESKKCEFNFENYR